ncbi:MAG: ABC transporter substrate-binding protein [Actinomycetota bacterium]
MRRNIIAAVVLAITATIGGVVLARTHSSSNIVVGAIYPTGGPQGSGGLAEYHGVELAASLANSEGGVNGSQIVLRLAPADSSDQADSAVRTLVNQGIPVIIGSHGSTISRPAAAEALATDTVFWETGAVGELATMGVPAPAPEGARIFRFAPSGEVLGSSAIRFAVTQLLPKLHRNANALRYGVAFVNDEYGRAVGKGAIDQIGMLHLQLAGTFAYKSIGANFDSIAHRIAAAHTDVLFVSAYLDDGVALRNAIVKLHVPLVANIGTSSSYCMPEFGAKLGAKAVGLFASDKPDGPVVSSRRLTPEAAHALDWARTQYKALYRQDMSAPALSGFTGAWALFHYVLPKAKSTTAAAISDAAHSVAIDEGGLPNGSGLQFGPARANEPAENLRATSVIWEWVRPGVRAVVWPPAFATAPLKVIAL